MAWQIRYEQKVPAKSIFSSDRLKLDVEIDFQRRKLILKLNDIVIRI